jgi:hypothetical protein
VAVDVKLAQGLSHDSLEKRISGSRDAPAALAWRCQHEHLAVAGRLHGRVGRMSRVTWMTGMDRVARVAGRLASRVPGRSGVRRCGRLGLRMASPLAGRRRCRGRPGWSLRLPGRRQVWRGCAQGAVREPLNGGGQHARVGSAGQRTGGHGNCNREFGPEDEAD